MRLPSIRCWVAFALLSFLAGSVALALDSPPRDWLVELRGPRQALAARLLPSSRIVADGAGGCTLLLETSDGEWLPGLLLAASFDARGEVRWQRRLGAELGDLVGRRSAAQFADGVVVLAAEGLEELIVEAYGADGDPLWSLSIPATSGYRQIGPAAIGPGPAGAIWVVATEENPGSDRRFRLLEVAVDGTLAAEVSEPGLGTPSPYPFVRFVGATSDRVFLLTRGLSGYSGTTLLALAADGSLLWQSAVFDDPGREAEIVDVELGAVGGMAVLGAGEDWESLLAAGERSTPRFGPELFDPDPWQMMAVAIVDGDGIRRSVAYEAQPNGSDLIPMQIRTGSDGAVYVGAIVGPPDLTRESSRAGVFAFDAELRRRWIQYSWDRADFGTLALAPRPGGGVTLITPACDGRGSCPLRVASLSSHGRVDATALGPLAATSSLYHSRAISADWFDDDLRVAFRRPSDGGPDRFALAQFAPSGELSWGTGVELELPFEPSFSRGLAPDGEGGVVVAGRAWTEVRLVRVDFQGDVVRSLPLPGLLSTAGIGPRPGGGILVGATASRDPGFPQWSSTEDILMASLTPGLDELWRGYSKGPGSVVDDAQSLATGGGQVCVSASSRWSGEEVLFESHLFCRDLEGDPRWSARVDGPLPNTFQTRVALSRQGDAAVTSSAFWYEGLDLVVFDRSGRLLWERRTDAPLEQFGYVRVLGLDFGPDGDLLLAAGSYFQADRTGLWSFDGEGAIRWVWDPIAAAGGPLTTELGVGADRVFVAGCYQHWIGGAQEPYVAAVDLAGRTLWITRFPGPVDCGLMTLGVDGCGEPMLAARLFPSGREVAVASLSSAGELRWIDRMGGVDTLLPVNLASDDDGSTWLELAQRGELPSVLLARYPADCGAVP